MQADLYNLQPAIGEVNGLRRNYQIGIINGKKREFGKCDVEISNKIIEPAERIRGILQEHTCIWKTLIQSTLNLIVI